MAWTSPTAPAASSLITTSFWTAQISNNLLECAPAKFVARGDGFFASGPNAGQRVAVSAVNGNAIVANSACTAGVAYNTAIVLDPTNGHLGVGQATNLLGAYTRTLTVSASSDGNLVAVEMRGARTGAVQTIGSLDYWNSASRVAAILAENGTCNNHAYLAFYTASGGTLAERARLANGQFLVGATASNTNMTAGLTINQGAADNEILALKSSDVAHGVTGLTETDTFAAFKKFSATDGGFRLDTLSDGTIQSALRLLSVVTAAADTTKSITGTGVIQLDAALKSGTSYTVIGANGNLVTILNGDDTKFIFDADGDLAADAAVTASAFDAHDDALLCRAIDLHVSQPDTLIRTRFDEWAEQYDRDFLKRAKLVYLNDDGSKFVCYTQLARLHTGAIWQGYQRDMELAERLERLERAALAVGIDPKLLDPPDTG